MLGRHEYRVTWRRDDWGRTTSDKTRTFDRLDVAERFVEKLRSDGRPDLSPVTKLKVAYREVGTWMEGWQ